MQPKAQLRIRIILALVLVVGLAIIGRLYWLQIVQNNYYQERANQQYINPQGGLFDRGTIYFTTKDGVRVAAATVEQGFSLAINPEKLTDAASVFEKINIITPINRTKFMASAAKKNDPYEEIATALDYDVGEKISTLDIPGIIISKDAWRYYPTGALGAETVGIIGYATSSQLTGQYGLEKYYDSTLARNDNNASVNFFAELFSDIKSTVLNGQSLEGDVITTLEPSVEAYLGQVLAATKKQWQSEVIGGIIIDPKTGAIYAMDSLPSYDPNNRALVSDPSVFANPLVQNVYEMGSIMKPMTMSAAIDSGRVTASTTYNDTGSVVVDGRKISNFDLKARGIVPMQQILSQSLNVGATYLALTMGSSTMQKYFLSYGLGSTTGIDQPNEQAGLIKNIKGGRDVNYATAAFGQGIAITPIEMVRALSSIANGGYLVTPHIASEVNYDIGGGKTIAPSSGPRVFSTTTSAIVTNMLVNVVDQVMAPASSNMSRPGYSIAAKTGTAQIADPINGGYYADRYLHSFFGFFPAHNPRFLVFLFQVYPKNVEYASQTLTNPFAQIASYLISYYDIPPDR
jgi:cell division protein FtsI/penicillin-binding protein 2